MCGRMFLEESDEVKMYVGGLRDNVQGYVMSARPKTMQEAIELANDLIDQKVRAYAERQAENKCKLDNNNQAQQQPPKKQNVARAYSAGPSEKKEYVGTLPLCNKCKFYHNGSCTNQNRGNQAGNSEARREVYALGGGETDQDANNIEDGIEA
uniref:Reverse transcriptase domain-containing protein n=1 Tax=Tanacetum cinerariifolium TaxID=118510 RepID=A0A699IQ38_TANCI|nr:reverse transcriptase domain-containing protein [Tanacetum cinerariifolium]